MMSRMSIPVEKIAARLKINRKTAAKYSENPKLIQTIKKFLNRGLACNKVAENPRGQSCRNCSTHDLFQVGNHRRIISTSYASSARAPITCKRRDAKLFLRNQLESFLFFTIPMEFFIPQCPPGKRVFEVEILNVPFMANIDFQTNFFDEFTKLCSFLDID